jgi:hypothetical protein
LRQPLAGDFVLQDYLREGASDLLAGRLLSSDYLDGAACRFISDGRFPHRLTRLVLQTACGEYEIVMGDTLRVDGDLLDAAIRLSIDEAHAAERVQMEPFDAKQVRHPRAELHPSLFVGAHRK